MEEKRSDLYKFDLIYNKSTARKFCNAYNIKMQEEEDKIENFIKKILESNKLKETFKLEHFKEEPRSTFDSTLSKFKIGDKVKVTFIPASQKYIDFYDKEAFVGEIIFIDEENDNCFFVVRNSNEIIIKSLEREGCHYFGMTRGYYYSIKKIEV